jgi:carbamoyltransferase
MEYGPRALGARSILAPAADPALPHALNRRLERSEFMPFAPVTTDALAPKCFAGWRPDHAAARFMTLCYPCTDYFKQKCPAAVHVDGTARPQVVFRDHNSGLYDTVRLVHERTGAPAIINTSFNRHEEPIVNTPDQAVRALQQGWIDVLLIGGFAAGL